MDRVTRFNVIAMSGKAVEACGDVDTMILDKTGTITYGNRLAAEFYPVKGVLKEDLIDYAVMTSLKDTTPEGIGGRTGKYHGNQDRPFSSRSDGICGVYGSDQDERR